MFVCWTYEKTSILKIRDKQNHLLSLLFNKANFQISTIAVNLKMNPTGINRAEQPSQKSQNDLPKSQEWNEFYSDLAT